MEVQLLIVPGKSCGNNKGLPVCHKAYMADKCLQEKIKLLGAVQLTVADGDWRGRQVSCM